MHNPNGRKSGVSLVPVRPLTIARRSKDNIPKNGNFIPDRTGKPDRKIGLKCFVRNSFTQSLAASGFIL